MSNFIKIILKIKQAFIAFINQFPDSRVFSRTSHCLKDIGLPTKNNRVKNPGHLLNVLARQRLSLKNHPGEFRKNLEIKFLSHIPEDNQDQSPQRIIDFKTGYFLFKSRIRAELKSYQKLQPNNL